jgi:hypothetical protein
MFKQVWQTTEYKIVQEKGLNDKTQATDLVLSTNLV